MATRDDKVTQAKQKEREYVRGGKGRKDEVGRSGIYPASSPNTPADAEVRSESTLVGHRGGRRSTNPSAEEDYARASRRKER